MTAIVYIDVEHDQALADPARGAEHRARVDTTCTRLTAASGAPCLAMRFSAVSLTEIERLAPSAIVIGGSTTDWAAYEDATLAGLLETIRAAPTPILGICAGHQLVGFAHGASWGSLGPLRPGEVDPDPRFAAGQRKERGFSPVRLDPRCKLFRGLGQSAAFFQSHYWQLERTPEGFVARASSPWSPIQAIERLDRPVFGVQFHPERYDNAHPDGAIVLRNFFALVRDSGTDDPPERTDRGA